MRYARLAWLALAYTKLVDPHERSSRGSPGWCSRETGRQQCSDQDDRSRTQIRGTARLPSPSPMPRMPPPWRRTRLGNLLNYSGLACSLGPRRQAMASGANEAFVWARQVPNHNSQQRIGMAVGRFHRPVGEHDHAHARAENWHQRSDPLAHRAGQAEGLGHLPSLATSSWSGRTPTTASWPMVWRRRLPAAIGDFIHFVAISICGGHLPGLGVGSAVAGPLGKYA